MDFLQLLILIAKLIIKKILTPTSGRRNKKTSLSVFGKEVFDYSTFEEMTEEKKHDVFYSIRKDHIKKNKQIEAKLNNAGDYNNRGITKGKLGDYAGAIADLDKAIELDPDYIVAYYYRGVSKKKLSYYKSAMADFDRALKLDPLHADAYYEIVKARIKQYIKTMRDFMKKIKLKFF